jgi:tetratricopeptide (TPR) repeat protein
MRRKLNVKLVVGTFGGLLILSAATYALHECQVRRNAHQLLERADRAVEEKDYEKALTLYPQYLNFVPNDPDTVQKYAEVLDGRAGNVGERVRLVVLMDQVLRVKPNENALRVRLVHNLIALGRHADALDHLQKLLARARDKAEVHHMIGWCLEAKKDYPQAAKAFAMAVKLDPTRIESYALLVEVLQDRLRQPDAALQVMNDMVKANADSHQAYLLRARFQRRRGEEQTAALDLQTASRLSPDDPDVILEVADAARARGQWDEAARLLKDGVKRYPEYAAFYKALADGAFRAGQIDEAIAHLKEGLKASPKSTELAVLLIDLLIDQKQYGEARAKIDELLQAGLRPTLPNYLTARLRMADSHWREAIKLLESARRDLGPTSGWSGRVNLLLGLSYRQVGDHEQDLQSFRRAVAAEPGWVMANVGLGAALLDNGRLEEASQILEPLRKSKEAPAGVRTLLARCRLYGQARLPETKRQWDNVEEALAEAAQAEPTGIDVPLLRAELLTLKRDFDGANAVLEKVQHEHPGEIAVWRALADLAARQNRIDDAVKILDQAAQQPTIGDRVELRIAKARLWGWRANPDDLAKLGAPAPSTYSVEDRVRLQCVLAEMWYRLGRGDRAGQLWRMAAVEAPDDLRSRFALVEFALHSHDVAAARRWQEALRAIEGDAGYLWRFADAAILVRQAHGQAAKLVEARKKLQELEATHKDWPRIPLLLAAISEMEAKNDQAMQEYGRALDLGEMQPRTLARLLELLLARREFGKAESALAKYEQKLPLTPELAKLGAEACLGLRDRPSARLAVQRAESAVALPSRDYRDYLWLAPIYHAAGDDAQAEKMLQAALELASHAPDVWIAWLEHLALTNQRSLALQEIERLKTELPTDRQELTLARCYDAMHLQDAAAKAYEAALKDRPSDFALLAYAADFFRRADQPHKAIPLYERLLDPALAAPAESAVRARRHLAVLLTKGDRQRALALVALNAKSWGDTAADERIRLYIQGQDERARYDAIKQYQDALRRQPPTPAERVLLAELQEAAGNLGAARSQLSAAVDESPSEPRYLVRFARLLIRTGEREEAGRVIAHLELLEPASERVGAVKASLVRAERKAKGKML